MKKKFFYLCGYGAAFAFLLMLMAQTVWPGVPENTAKGSLVIAGGAVLPDNAEIYGAFIALGGGKDAIRIAIIPAAGNSPVTTSEKLIKTFSQHGVSPSRCKIFPVAVLDDPDTPGEDESKWSGNGFSPELAEEILHYTAVFFIGGDQMRYRQTLTDEKGADGPMLKAIREIHRRGGVLGGTSAGAAIMSHPMFLGGDPLKTLSGGVCYEKIPSPREPEGKAWLSDGFGFFPFGLVDQHVLKRGRTTRMIPALFYLKNLNQGVLGFGIDEDTALICRDGILTVAGASGVLITDVSGASQTHSPSGPSGKDILLHYLESGDSFNTRDRSFTIAPARANSPIPPGKEYYETSPTDTNILRKDGIRDMITTGLADNRQEKAEGLYFSLNPDGTGRGMRLTFWETPETRKFFAAIRGVDTYSVLAIRLAFQPIEIRITPAR